MKGGLGNEGIVVFLGESPASMEGGCDDTYSLELGARVANRVLVDSECLGEELVAILFEACLIGYFATHHEQSQSQVRASGIYLLVEAVYALMHEPIKSGRLCLPIVVVVLTSFEFTSQAYR